MKKENLEKMAKVLVKIGVNLQEDQILILQTDIEGIDLARAVCKEAFLAKARDVVVIINDSEVDHLRGLHGDEKTLRQVPDYRLEQLDYYLRTGKAVQMSLMGTYPTLMADVDENNAKAIALANNDVRNVIRKYIHKGTLQWTGSCIPNKEWALKVYPELSPEKALEQLEDDIACMMRLDNDDPVQAWKDHLNHLSTVSTKLNEYDFKKVHVTSELGTDIEMEMVEGHIWTSAGDEGSSLTSVPYCANMPTEEIFSDPNCYTVEGIAYASRPLIISGKLVKDFWIKFKNGLAVDCGAKEGESILRAQLFQNERTRRLGEIALVSKQSVITKLDRVYYNGLIDENAASHLAFGSSFPANVKNGTSISKEELERIGVNDAICHNDFMIGTPGFKVIGITKDNKEVAIMENGDFVI